MITERIDDDRRPSKIDLGLPNVAQDLENFKIRSRSTTFLKEKTLENIGKIRETMVEASMFSFSFNACSPVKQLRSYASIL